MFQNLLPHEFHLRTRLSDVLSRTGAYLAGCESATLRLNVDSLPCLADRESVYGILSELVNVPALKDLADDLKAVLTETLDSLLHSSDWERDGRMLLVADEFARRKALSAACRVAGTELQRQYEDSAPITRIEALLRASAIVLKSAVMNDILVRSEYNSVRQELIKGKLRDCVSLIKLSGVEREKVL